MANAILWIARNQQWLYLILGVATAWQLFRWWRLSHRLRFTLFGIEREMLINARNQAMTLAFILATLMTAVLLLSGFIAPNLTPLLGAPPTPTVSGAPTALPTATPTPPLVLPGFESPTPEVTLAPPATQTPVPAGGSGCLNPLATITQPIPGAVLSGEVEVRGTANITNFAFYKVEISTLGANWLTVITDSKPVVNDVLGKWDTRLQLPGDYALRLLVFDSNGASPEPCTIPITIVQPTPTTTPP